MYILRLYSRKWILQKQWHHREQFFQMGEEDYLKICQKKSRYHFMISFMWGHNFLVWWRKSSSNILRWMPTKIHNSVSKLIRTSLLELELLNPPRKTLQKNRIWLNIWTSLAWNDYFLTWLMMSVSSIQIKLSAGPGSL